MTTPVEPRLVRRATGALDATVVVPGSKSIANRALVCAALATGDSTIDGVAPGDDTQAMIGGLRRLGLAVDLAGERAIVHGRSGVVDGGGTVHAALAGTTSRMLTAAAALGAAATVIDGLPPLRTRPMGPLHAALESLGAQVEPLAGAGHLPVRVARAGLRGGTVRLPGDVSSQFITSLMLIAPLLPGGLRVQLTTPLVSRPYVSITASVMAAFGASGVDVGTDEIVVAEGAYAGTHYVVEPDASSASYPLAAAALCGGSVHVLGLGVHPLQGDARFGEVLAAMGCTVSVSTAGTTVSRDPTASLQGLEINMADISDLVPTMAVVAPFASTPTRITGVGFVRAKESDRIGDLVAELAKLGVDAEEQPDGMVVHPGNLVGAEVATHHDHRLAMALALVGLRVEGVRIADPDVVTKSWPGYWEMLDALSKGA